MNSGNFEKSKIASIMNFEFRCSASEQANRPKGQSLEKGSSRSIFYQFPLTNLFTDMSAACLAGKLLDNLLLITEFKIKSSVSRMVKLSDIGFHSSNYHVFQA